MAIKFFYKTRGVTRMKKGPKKDQVKRSSPRKVVDRYEIARPPFGFSIRVPKRAIPTQATYQGEVWREYWSFFYPVKGGVINVFLYGMGLEDPRGKTITATASIKERVLEDGTKHRYIDIHASELEPEYDFKVYPDRADVPDDDTDCLIVDST